MTEFDEKPAEAAQPAEHRAEPAEAEQPAEHPVGTEHGAEHRAEPVEPPIGHPGPWTVWPPPYAPTSPASWAPPPLPVTPPARARGAGFALTVVAALVAGMLGAAIGNRLARTSTSRPGTAGLLVPSTPDNGSGSHAAISGVASKVVQSVVDINTRLSYQGAQAAGTGLVLTSSGDIITNNHVIDGATSISVTIVDTGRSYAAKVVGTDPSADIAVIRLQGVSGLHAISTGASPVVSPGDQVLAIGNAGGAGGIPSVVTGTVSATDQAITASDPSGANAERLTGLIETNAPIEPGDSGGPLVNSGGAVIGINTAASSRNRFDSSTAVGFAIPISQAVSIAHQIESGAASSTVHIGLPAFLGVSIDTSQGTALVAGVESDSPAAALGIQNGDTITTVDGRPVGSPTNLTTLLRVHHPGEKATIGWTDANGGRHTGSATLIPGPAD